MKNIFIVIAYILLYSLCWSIPVEDSVVSVYTTLPTTAGTNPPLDVYYQIANNIAEKITSPIYRFLGYNTTTTVLTDTTKQTVRRNELLDELDDTTNHNVKPIDNDIASTRDVEELSPGRRIPQKKPEKFTFYSSSASTYLPSKLEDDKARSNDFNSDEDDDSLSLDDVDIEEKPTPREGPLIYILEWIGSVIQLLYGAISSLFKSK